MLLNEQTGYFHQVEGWTLNCAVTGAVLADLSLNARIDMDEKSLFVLDDGKMDDPILDLCLAEIASHESLRGTRYWIERLAVHSEHIIDTTLKRLVDLDILTYHDGEFYTINHSNLHQNQEEQGGKDGVRQYIKSRIEKVVFADIIPDPEESLIIGLLNACDIMRFIFDLDEECENRIERACQIEAISRAISTGVEQSIIAPVLQQTPISRKIPSISMMSLLSNRHITDGCLPAILARLADKYGPVFQMRLPFQEPLVFLAGANVNRWIHRNSRMNLTSGNYFREMETACGAQGLITSLDGADHFRLRKVMKSVYAPSKFDERMHEMRHLARHFMSMNNWQPGADISLKRATRLMINLQMTRIMVSTDTQDIFEELCHWKERAFNVYAGHILPQFMARTPLMRRRFKLLQTFMRRIEQNHTPIQRAGARRELADDLISLHASDPQFLPEQNLPFMLASGPILQSMYVGDMLGFVLYEMARHPLLAAQIREEAEAIFDNNGSTSVAFSKTNHDVTRRFLMECLRLYPVVSMQVRNVANSCVVENYSLPLGKRVHIVQTATHYMSDCFPEPYKFDIDRYLPSRKEHQSTSYAPYGLGTHLCVGSQWMNLQMILAMMTVAYHFEFEPLPENFKLRINPFPNLSVTKKMKLRIAKQFHELPP